MEPRIRSLVDETVPTCAVDERLGAVRARLAPAGANLCVVLDAERVVLGSLRGRALDGAADTPVAEAMDPAPSTYRPDTSLHEMAEALEESGARRVLVTTTDGRLLGVLRREAVEQALHALHAAHAQHA
jgi:CBS domain-containing protein